MMVRQNESLIGHASTGHGIGCGAAAVEEDWGYSYHSRKMLDYVMQSGDFDMFASIGSMAKGIASKAASPAMYLTDVTGLFSRLERLCRNVGIVNVLTMDDYASYQNTGAGGPYNCLLSPAFAALISPLMRSKKFKPHNLYFPGHIEASEHDLMQAIDPSQYAGCTSPVAVVSGSTFAAGSKKLVVVGTARIADGSIEDSRVWTATISDDGDFPLTPNKAGDLMLSVTSIRNPAAMEAGAVLVTCDRPAGRP